MIKERPILFSAPMIRAILAGRKTQTRRIVKEPCQTYLRNANGTAEVLDGVAYNYSFVEKLGACPYGKLGDRLWVRETWAATGTGVWTIADARRQTAPDQRIVYKADDYESEQGIPASALVDGWWPSIHMPREFSRILLEITDIRVERLQSISTEDADAEGFGGDFPHKVFPEFDPGNWAEGLKTIPECFADIWIKINGPDSWTTNPFVWAISFRRIQQEMAAA